MRMKHAAAMAGLALGLMSGAAKAAYIINFEQVGMNVVETGMGSVDTDGLTDVGVEPYQGAFVGPFNASTVIGSSSGFETYTGATGPDSFANALYTDADSTTGVGVGVRGGGGDGPFLYLPIGYVSNSVLGPSTSIFDNTTITNLGLTPGSSYTYVIPGAGPESFGDTFTVDIGGSLSAVPLPASAPMFGAALMALGVVGYGLKRKRAIAT